MKSAAALRAELDIIQSSSSPLARGPRRGVSVEVGGGGWNNAGATTGDSSENRPGTSHARSVPIQDGLGALHRRPPTQSRNLRGNNIGRIGGGSNTAAPLSISASVSVAGSMSPSPRRDQALQQVGEPTNTAATNNGGSPVYTAAGGNSLMATGFSMLAREYLAVGYYEGARDIAQRENDIMAWVAALILSGNPAKASAIIETSIIMALVTTYCKWKNVTVKPFAPYLQRFFKSASKNNKGNKAQSAAQGGGASKQQHHPEGEMHEMYGAELAAAGATGEPSVAPGGGPESATHRKEEETIDFSTVLGLQVDSKDGSTYLRIDFRTILQCVADPTHPSSLQYFAALPKPTEEESSMLKDAIGTYISVEELAMWYLISVVLQNDFKPPVNLWTKRFFGLLSGAERLQTKKSSKKLKTNELISRKNPNGGRGRRSIVSGAASATSPSLDLAGASSSTNNPSGPPPPLTRADIEDLLIAQTTVSEMQVVQAYTSFQLRRFHSAVEVTTEILEKDPNDFPMRYIRCVCSIKIGDRKTANEDCLILTKSVSRFVCAVGLAIATYALPNKNALQALRDIKLTKEEESYVFGIGEWVHGLTILHLGNFVAARAIARNAITAVIPKSRLESWLYDIEFCAALALRDRNTLINIPLQPLRALHLSLVPYFGGGYDNPSFNRIEMTSAVGKLLNPPYTISNYIDARHAVPMYFWQSRSMFSFGRLHDAWQMVLAAVSAAEELLGSTELCLCDCAPHRVLMLGINIGLALLDDIIERGGTQDVDPSDKEAVEKRASDDQLGDDIMMLCRMWAKKLRYHHPRMVTGYCAVAQVAIAAQEPNNVERAATISDSFPQSVQAQNLMPYALFSRHLIPDAIASARRTLHRFPHVPEVRSLFEIVSNRVGSYSHVYRSVVPVHFRFADDSPKTIRTMGVCALLLMHFLLVIAVSAVNIARWQEGGLSDDSPAKTFSDLVEVHSFIPMIYGLIAVIFTIFGVLINRSLISFAFQELHFRDTPLQRALFCLRGIPYINIAHAFLIWWEGSEFELQHIWVGFAPLFLGLVCLSALPFSTRVFFLRSMDEPDDGFTFWLSMLFMDLITFIAFSPLQILSFVVEPFMYVGFFIFMPSVTTAESGDVKIRLREQYRSNKIGSRRWVVGSGSNYIHLLVLRLLYLDTHSALETTYALRKQEEEDDYRAFPLVFMLEPPSAAPRETPSDRQARLELEAEEERLAKQAEANGEGRAKTATGRDKRKRQKSANAQQMGEIECDDAPVATAVTLDDLGYKFGGGGADQQQQQPDLLGGTTRASAMFASTVDFGMTLGGLDLDGDGGAGDIWNDDLFGDIVFDDSFNVSDDEIIGDFDEDIGNGKEDDGLGARRLSRKRSVLASRNSSKGGLRSSVASVPSFKIERSAMNSPAASPRLDVPNPLTTRSSHLSDIIPTTGPSATTLSLPSPVTNSTTNSDKVVNGGGMIASGSASRAPSLAASTNRNPNNNANNNNKPKTIGDMFVTKNRQEDDAIFVFGGLRNKIHQTENYKTGVALNRPNVGVGSNAARGSVFIEEANEEDDEFELESNDSLDFTTRADNTKDDGGPAKGRKSGINVRPRTALEQDMDKFNTTWGRLDMTVEQEKANERDQQVLDDEFELDDDAPPSVSSKGLVAAHRSGSKRRSTKDSKEDDDDDELSFLYPKPGSGKGEGLRGPRKRSGSKNGRRPVSSGGGGQSPHTSSVKTQDLKRVSSGALLGVDSVPSRTGSRGGGSSNGARMSPRADKTMGNSGRSNRRPNSGSQASNDGKTLGGGESSTGGIPRSPSTSVLQHHQQSSTTTNPNASTGKRRSAGPNRPHSSSVMKHSSTGGSRKDGSTDNLQHIESNSDSRSASRAVSRERPTSREQRRLVRTPSVRGGSASSRPGSVSDNFSPSGTPAQGANRRRRRQAPPPAAPANRDPALRPLSGNSNANGGVSPNYETIPLSRPSGSADSFGATPRNLVSVGSGLGEINSSRRRSAALDISSEEDLNFTGTARRGVGRTNSNRSLSKSRSGGQSPADNPTPGGTTRRRVSRRGSMRKLRGAPNISSVVSPISGNLNDTTDIAMRSVNGEGLIRTSSTNRVRTAPVDASNQPLPRTHSGRIGRTKSSTSLKDGGGGADTPPPTNGSDIINANIKIRKVLDDLRIAKQMVGSLLNAEQVEKQLQGAKIKFVQDVFRIGKKISVETYESKKQLLQLFEETFRDGDEVLGNMEVMKCLLYTIVSLDLGAYISSSELHVQSATKGNTKYLELFLQHPTVLANLDIRTIENLLGKCVRLVGVPRRTACLLAILKGLKDSNLVKNRADDMLNLWHSAIEQILSSGNVPPNYAHFTPTQLSQRRELFQLIVKHPFIPFNLTTREASDKQTVFSRACREGDAPLVITVLQSKKEDASTYINRVQSDGTNALQQAAARGHLDVVKLLLGNPHIAESVYYEFPGRGTALQLAINMKRDPKMIQMFQAKAAELGPKKNAAEEEYEGENAALKTAFERHTQQMANREKKAVDGTTQVRIMVSVLRPTYEQLNTLRKRLHKSSKKGNNKKNGDGHFSPAGSDDDDELDFSDDDISNAQQAGADMATVQEINRLSEITAQQKQNMITKIPRLGEDVLIVKEEVKKDIVWLLDQLFLEADEKDNNNTLVNILLNHLAVNFDFAKLAVERQWIATACENGSYNYLDTLLTKIPFVSLAIQNTKGEAIEEILDGVCDSRIHRVEVLHKLLSIPAYKSVMNFRQYKFTLKHNWQRVGEQILSGEISTTGELRKSFPNLVEEVLKECERGHIEIDFASTSVKTGNHSIFSKACEMGNVALVTGLLKRDTLLSKSAANAFHPVTGMTPLMYAIQRGHTPTIHALIKINPGFIDVDLAAPKIGNKNALQIAEELSVSGKLTEEIVELIATAE